MLVFLRDRGIFMLWGLLIVVFAFWCSPYFFTVDNALLIANAGALTALFAAGVGIGIMTGVLDLSLPGTAAIAAASAAGCSPTATPPGSACSRAWRAASWSAWSTA